MDIVLGELYKDSVTKFLGVATGRAEYLNSNPRVLLERMDDSGSLASEWFDESRLVAS